MIKAYFSYAYDTYMNRTNLEKDVNAKEYETYTTKKKELLQIPWAHICRVFLNKDGQCFGNIKTQTNEYDGEHSSVWYNDIQNLMGKDDHFLDFRPSIYQKHKVYL